MPSGRTVQLADHRPARPLLARRTLLNRVSITSVVVAALGILAIGFAAAGIFIHPRADFASAWIPQPDLDRDRAVLAISMFIVYRIELSSSGREDEDEPPQTMRRALGTYALSAATVVIAAIWLATVVDDLAQELGIERSFVGTQFLAVSTSLPELAASVAAIRIGAPELAISNVLGSNLFNMGFVLFLDDVAYTSGPLWAAVSTVHIFTALAAVLMTAVVIVALATRERGRPGRFFTFEALMLIGLYIVTSALGLRPRLSANRPSYSRLAVALAEYLVGDVRGLRRLPAQLAGTVSASSSVWSPISGSAVRRV